MWQTIENKQKFISQIMISEALIRVAEDIDESFFNYADIKVLANGVPKIKEKMNLDNEVTKLKMLEANYNSNRYRLEGKVSKTYQEDIARTEKLIEAVKKNIVSIEPKTKGEEEFISVTIAEEKRNENPFVEDVKRAIIDFRNREYEENHSYDEFDTLYPDLKHIGIAYTNTPDERHEIQYELNLEEKTWTQYVNDTPIKTESFDYENKGENKALKNMKNEIEMSYFSDLVYVDSEDLRAATGLYIDDEGNFYNPLSKDLDNDGIRDR